MNWSARVVQAWIAPVGQQTWQQVFSAGTRTPSTSFMRFDTRAFPNGRYDLLIEFFVPPSHWATHCYGQLIEIRNVPPAPAGLTATPRQSPTDRFTFSWQPSQGAVRYSYASSCGSNIGAAGVTGGTSVTLANVLPYRGSYTFCVRGIDAAGNVGQASSVYYEWQRAAISLTAVSWPTTIPVGSAAAVGARLVEARPSGQVGVPGQPLSFSYSYSGGGAYTDRTGFGRTNLPFQVPGTYVGRIHFPGSSAYQPASTTVTFQVVRDTTPPTTPTVRVDPPTSTVNRFTASWTASTDASGISHYRYRVDGGAESGTSALGVTGPLAPGFGTHRVEVRAFDRTGNASAWSAPATFVYVRPSTPSPVPTPPPATPRPTDPPAATTSPGPSQRISVDIPTR